MLSYATIKYVRMSPRKIRYVIGSLRRQTVAQALRMLGSANRRACEPVAKAIASAFANAKHADPALAEDQVIITRLTADGGPVWKRFRAAAFGRATSIRKPTSHIRVELDRLGDRRPPVAAAAAAEAKKSAAPKPVRKVVVKKPVAKKPAAKKAAAAA